VVDHPEWSISVIGKGWIERHQLYDTTEDDQPLPPLIRGAFIRVAT
jgi:hypothetical protein